MSFLKNAGKLIKKTLAADNKPEKNDVRRSKTTGQIETTQIPTLQAPPAQRQPSPRLSVSPAPPAALNIVQFFKQQGMPVSSQELRGGYKCCWTDGPTASGMLYLFNDYFGYKSDGTQLVGFWAFKNIRIISKTTSTPGDPTAIAISLKSGDKLIFSQFSQRDEAFAKFKALCGKYSMKEGDSLPLSDALEWYTSFSSTAKTRLAVSRAELEAMVAAKLGQQKVATFRTHLLNIFPDQEEFHFFELVRVLAALEDVATSGAKVKVSWRTAQSAEKIFTALSKNHGDKIPNASFADNLRRLIPYLTAVEAAEITKRIDRNGQGIRFENVLTGLAESIVPLPVASSALGRLSKMDELKITAFKAFCKFDKDMSGSINIDELTDLLRTLYPKITRPEINAMYRQMDADHSGLITFDEFLQGVEAFSLDLGQLDLTPQRATTPTHERRPSMSNGFEWEIPHTQLNLGKKIGEGSFGVVFKGTWHGTTVAIKKLKYDRLTADVLEDFRNEIAILGKLRHPNVLLFMGACTQVPNFCIVTEFLSGGSVYDLMHTKRVRFSNTQIVTMLIQAARGLNYLHNHHPQIIHRDLKSLNFLCDSNGNVKLADFGLSAIKQPAADLKDQVGTPVFMAPELLEKKPYNEKVDTYSFGICLWEMLTGELPFPGLSFQELKTAVVTEQKRPPIPAGCHPGFARIMQSCWHADASKRPSMADLLRQLEDVSASIAVTKTREGAEG